MQDRTHDARSFRILNVIDEYTRECLATVVKRHLTHEDVMICLTKLFCQRGMPAHIRSDNGPEFIAKALRRWLKRLDVAPYSSNQAARGKMAMWNLSMAKCAMNYWLVKSSIRSKRPKS